MRIEGSRQFVGALYPARPVVYAQNFRASGWETENQNWGLYRVVRCQSSVHATQCNTSNSNRREPVDRSLIAWSYVSFKLKWMSTLSGAVLSPVKPIRISPTEKQKKSRNWRPTQISSLFRVSSNSPSFAVSKMRGKHKDSERTSHSAAISSYQQLVHHDHLSRPWELDPPSAESFY